MTRLVILSAATALSMMTITPVFAMAAVQEPGAFAFSHPNADVLNATNRVFAANAKLERHITRAALA